MSVERAQEKQLLKNVKNALRKAALPTLVGTGLLFPATVYANTENVDERSKEISQFLDNRQAEIIEGSLLLAGGALTVQSYLAGRKFDENMLRVLRTTGPVLSTAAAGSLLLDSQTPINFAIPAGLALSASYAFAATNIISTFEQVRSVPLRAASVAVGSSLVIGGAVAFLAAADKL